MASNCNQRLYVADPLVHIRAARTNRTGCTLAASDAGCVQVWSTTLEKSTWKSNDLCHKKKKKCLDGTENWPNHNSQIYISPWKRNLAEIIQRIIAHIVCSKTSYSRCNYLQLNSYFWHVEKLSAVHSCITCPSLFAQKFPPSDYDHMLRTYKTK